LEYDLLALNLDIRLVGSEGLSWRRLLVLAGQCAADPHRAVYRSVAGPNADWRLPEVLASRLVNAAEYSNFLTYQINKGNGPDWPTPEPVYPPWMAPPAEARDEDRFGNARMSIEDANEWLGW
jgi:hypothetical protein